jgi:hypothetical protein
MSSPAVDAQELAIGGTAVITSTPKNKVALSLPGDRYTAFTGALITLLARGPRIPDEPLTVSTAYQSLRVALAERNLPEPKSKVTDSSGGILLRRNPPPPPPPPPAPDPLATKPALPVVPMPPWIVPRIPAFVPAPPMAPPPVTQQPARSAQTLSLARLFLISFGWFLIWFWFYLGVSFGIGFMVGALAGTAADLAPGIFMLAVAAVCGFFLGRRYLRSRGTGHRPPSLWDIRPDIASHLAIPRTIAAAFLLALFVVGVIAAILSPIAPKTDVPNIGEKVSLIIATVEGALASAHRLYTGRLRAKARARR